MTMERPGGPEYIAPDIHIERLNTDKTRKDLGIDAGYQVFFELSGSPAPEWKSIFSQEWKEMNLPHKADIDETFLVLHCQLHDVTPALLAALQKAVTKANEAYHLFAQGVASAVTHREEEWEQERRDVEAVASSLHFG
jgi:hypothetical protein